MLPVASTRPFRLATLRDLTRLALTALVLAVGVGGLFAPTAAPATAAPPRPAVTVARMAEPPATTRPTDEQRTDSPARPVPARRDVVTEGPLAVAVPATTTDPVREATGRRGPPRR